MRHSICVTMILKINLKKFQNMFNIKKKKNLKINDLLLL